MKSLSTESSILRNKKQILFNVLAVFNFAFLIAISASFLLAEPSRSDAATVTASAGSSIYTASISNSDSVTIPITPTSSQTEYASNVNDSKVIFSSTCPKGAYVYINTSSSNNSLTRTGSDTGVKTIDAVAGNTGLTDNTWGYKVSGNAFSAVPVSSSPAVLYTSTGVESNTPINLQYGVKVDNNIPSGTYTNDVVYTVAVKPECLAYTLKFDTQGGSAISDASINYGDTVDLNNYTTSRSGYIFGGWSNGTSDFTGKETTANPNPSNNFTVTLSACWVKNTPYAYDYTGGEQTFTAPCNGYYKLEVWGAQGGSSSVFNSRGGYGGYAVGISAINRNSKLYINTGGMPTETSDKTIIYIGGYNGGGDNYPREAHDVLEYAGGGATHIATVSGQLKYLSSYKNTGGTNISKEILITSGGGGGGAYYVAERYGYGGNGGGSIGTSGDTHNPSGDDCAHWGTGGTQTSTGSNYASSYMQYTWNSRPGGFGYGGTGDDTISHGWELYYGTKLGGSGGGGGWYGGAGSGCLGGAGGGSGYIGSSNLISGGGITKHMTCYSCTTSSVAATRTYSNTTTPTSTPTADVARIGNGYAKITYLGTTI
ncbi:InlB B-repeat-containing protein [Candidatus Saccharibacteria bacterium]|nr:InlB B-repeat-containing protein [Candidatus Saccharibacteria bacterium]